MKTRRQRELQAAEGVAVTPPQALEATRRNRRGGSRTTSRAPTTEPTQSQSNPVDLTLSESSEHGESQPEPAQSQPRSRPPKTRARAGKSVTRAQSKATSRAASRATSRAASRATSRAASRATTAEPAQLGSSQAEAIQIDSTESEPSEPDRSKLRATEAEYNGSEPTPSEPDLPAFVKAEIVDDGHPQPDFVQSEPPLLEPHYPQTPQSEPPRLEPTLFGFSQADAIQIDSTESEPSEPDRSEPQALEAEYNELEPTPSEPDQPVFVKTEVVDDGPAQPGSMQSGPPFLEPPHPQPLQSEPPQTEPSQVEAPRLETPQIEAPQVEAPRLEAPQGEAPQVEAPRLESPQAGPSQPTTSLTPNIDNQIKQEFGAHEPSTRKRRYEDTLLYDLRTRNAEADAKRQKLGRPKTKVTEVSAKYKMYKKRTEEERKARSAETSTQGETTQTDDPGPSEDDGSTARTSPENAPANATIATGPRNRNREDDELAHRVSPSKKSPISSRPFNSRSRSVTIEDPVEFALETSRARRVRADEVARTQQRRKATDDAVRRLQAVKAAAHPVHAEQTTAHPVSAASKETAAVEGEPSQAAQQVMQDPLPPANKVTLSDWIERGIDRLRNIPPGERTATEAADLKYFEDQQAKRDDPEWRPTAPTTIIAQPYDGKVTSVHVDFVEPNSRQNFLAQMKLRLQQEAEARAALAQAPRPPSLEDPALAIYNWPQASDAARHTLMKFCVSPQLAAECDASYHLDKHPLSLAVDDEVFLDIMHVLAIHPKTRHTVLYDLRNIHPSVKANSERMIDYDDPGSWPANSLASKLFAASPTRGTRTTSQPDRSRKLRPTPRASKPQAPKRRPALAEVDAQSHMEEGASSQTKPDRRTVRMPKYFTGPMDNRTVLHDYSQQDVSLIESDNLSSDDESMLDLNETQEEDAEMEDQSDRSGQVGQHIQSTGGPTTPTTQATPAATAQTTKSRGWGFGSLLPSAARTVSRFLPSWRQQPASLPPSPTQQPTTVPATEPRQRQHVSATQGQGRIARKKAITYSTIAREPSGAVRLMTKGAIGATKQKADNRKTLEWRAKRAEEEKAQAVARKEREKQDITDMKDKVIASLQQQLYDAKRGVISDNPANWPRRKERVPSHPQEETLASKDSVIRSLHKQLQDVQSVSRENVRQRREAESNQGQPIDLTRPTPLEKQKRKRVASPDIIPNPVANGFGMDLNYFGFDDDDSQYFENTEEDQESSPLISKRQRTSRFSATDKAIAPLNDTATESSNLDMTPRPSPPIGNPYQATPYTGRIFSNASVSSRQDALDRLFSEDPVSDQAAEQQDTASKEPQGSQPNTFTVPSEQPASHDEPQVSQPNTFTVPSPDEDTPQVTKPNPNPFFTMSSPTFGTQDKGQVSKSLFFNMPSAQAPTQQQPQASQPNIFTMPAEQASVPEQPQVTKPNPFLSMSSPSVTTQEQPQATKPNPFFSMSTPSFLPQAPVTQPDKFNMPAVPEQQPVTKPNPFFAMSSPSVTTQEQPQATKPNPFTVPAEQASVQEQPQVTKPNPFFSMSSPSVTAQDKPQVSKPNIFNVTAEKATVEEQAARQEQPQVNKPNPFFSMSSPSVLTQDKPQVIKPFFSNLPSPSVLPQPPVSQVNTSSVPAEQATVKEKANMQEQPQVTESNPPSVLTQDKPPVSKPIFSNLPTPSFSPQPRVSQPNAFTVPSPGATDSDFSFAETPTLSSPKASAPLNASQATPTPARKHHGPVLPFDITRTTKVWTGSKRRTAPTEKPPASPEKQPAPAEKEPAPAEKRSAPAEKVLAAAEQQPAAAEQQPAAAEQQPAPATPLPPTPSDVSLARQRDQALKYAAKTPSRLHEATRPSSTNVESEGSDDQTIKSLATLAPAPVAASASFQAPTTFPPSRYKSKEERVQAAEKRMKDLGLNHYEAFLNSEEFTEEARDAHNKVLKAYPKMTNEAVKVLIKQIFDYQVWSKATTGVTGNTFDLEVPKRPHQGPLTRRGPEPRPRPPAAGPVVAETSRPVQKRQATEDVEADLDAFEDMMRRPPKRAKPAVRQGVTSYDDTSVHSQPPPPQENFRFMDFYQKVLNDFEEEDAKKMAKKGP